jgi:tetratricopeptide (TPR) repeat protein
MPDAHVRLPARARGALASALARLRAALRRDDLPPPSAILVRLESARRLEIDGRPVVALPGQPEGLALDDTAARCWDLFDGRRSLLEIARTMAGEAGAPVPAVLDELRPLARRFQEALLALEPRDWELVHVHRHDVFAGTAGEGVVERRLGDGVVLHAAAEALVPGGAVEPWRARRRKRRRAAAAMKAQAASESRLSEAARAFDAGWDHCVAGRLDEAEAAFRRCVEIAPGWAHAHYQLGYVLLRLRRYDAAAGCFGATESMSPGHFMVREYLDQARRLGAGRLDHDAFLLFDRANAAGLRDPDAAIRLAHRALQITPDYPSARLILARAYQKKDRLDDALAELGRALRMEPDAATLCHALYSRGTIFMAQGRTEEAMRELEKVIQINGSAAATRSAIAALAASSGAH